MKYDFDKTLDHRKDGSYRWHQPEGTNEMLGMGTADLDFECAPCIKEACRRVMEENTYNYRYKSEDYYNALSDFYKRNYDMEIDANRVTNVPGTIGAIHIALRTFTSAGDKVLMHAPVFGPLKDAVCGADLQLVTSPLILRNGKYRIDFKGFETRIIKERPKVFLLVNPHNPTGRVFTSEELSKMADICERNGVVIISDEVHSLITYGDNKHIPILAVSDVARKMSVLITSLSKGYNIMSLPHALVIIDNEELRAAWEKVVLPYNFHFATNVYALAAVTSVLKGEADEWLAELTQYLEANLDACLEFFGRDDIAADAIRPEAGFLLWVDIRTAGIEENDLKAYFRHECNVDLNDGAAFGEEGKGFIRINFAVTHDVMTKALKHLEEALS